MTLRKLLDMSDGYLYVNIMEHTGTGLNEVGYYTIYDRIPAQILNREVTSFTVMHTSENSVEMVIILN